MQARKFGVRAAMPGFIGCKLCPDLVFVRPNFERYTHYSELARKGMQKDIPSGNIKHICCIICRPELIIQVFVAIVFQRYDPNFFATSLDEAYLDITEVCIERGITGEEVSLSLPIIITLPWLTY
jgi:Ca2+-transporting ATPase/DNA polymerase kappa